jgi:hypothetical protein
LRHLHHFLCDPEGKKEVVFLFEDSTV